MTELYTQYFSLRERPFTLLPDPDFLFWSRQHVRAFSVLEYGIVSRAPITVITGDVGAGKTTLVQKLLGSMEEDVTLGLVSNATGDRGELLHWILNALSIPVDASTPYYHRAECLTHVGDSQAVRSLTQCGEPMRFAMAAPIDLRNDFDSVSLRRLAKRTRDATQSRRLLALAEVYDGGSRTDASRIGGVGLQIIRDWVLRFNARGPDGLVDGKSPGAPSKLNADHRRALAEVVEAGPVPAVDGVVRWRRKDLARWLLETFAISLDETTV